MQFLKKLSRAIFVGSLIMALPGCNSPAGGVTPVSSVSSAPAGNGTASMQPGSRKKVFVVILENTDASQALQQPFLSQLVKQGALLTNYSDVGHPSQPNYIALTSGSTWGISDDNNHTIDVRHIGDLIEEKGLSWKTYAEEFPGGCDLSAAIGNYARKHVPFISYKNIQSNPARCAKIVNSSEFATDLAAGTLPDFTLYVPNNLNNGHDTGVAYADQWLSTTFSGLIQDPKFMKDNLLVVTFDEGSGGDQVYTVVYGDAVKAGATSAQVTGHYGLLATIEQVLGLGSLGQNDATAQPITGIWK